MSERMNLWPLTDGEWHTIPVPLCIAYAQRNVHGWAHRNGYGYRTRSAGSAHLDVQLYPRVTGAPCEAVREVLAGSLPNSPELADLIEQHGEAAGLILFDTAHSPFGRVQRWAHKATVGKLVRAGLLCAEHTPPHLPHQQPVL